MAATTTARAAATLTRDIAPECWGDQLYRLRKPHYNAAARLVADLGEVGVKTSTATISRLEDMPHVPDLPAQRVIAAVILILCDIHPERLGIRLDELPLRVYANLFGAPDDPSGLEISPTACNGKTLPPRARKARPAAVAA